MKKLLVLLLLPLLLLACEPTAPAPTPTVDATASFNSRAGVIGESSRGEPTAAQTPAEPFVLPVDGRLWTILLYIDADSARDAAALADLNALESVAANPLVDVVVQLARSGTGSDDEWTGARRYLVQPDDDVATIGSELVADLGADAQADAAALEAFVQWGVTTYPAQRVALVLWGQGVSAESATDTPSLTPAQLRQTLTAALAETDRAALDLVGFDASLTAQLDTLAALNGVADVVVAAESLLPAGSWPYAALLTSLATAPVGDGRGLGERIVQTFAAQVNDSVSAEPLALAAVQMGQFDAVTMALANAAQVLSADVAFHAPAVQAARDTALTFAQPLINERDRIAAVDLQQFAALLNQRSPDPAVQTAAQQLQIAVDRAVVAVGGQPAAADAGGISVYFPANVLAYDGAYGAAAAVGSWNEFLIRYHAVSQDVPQLAAALAADDPVSQQNPTLVRYELSGRSLAGVQLVVGQSDGDGRRQLLAQTPIAPDERLTGWRDGWRTGYVTWDTTAPYVNDAEVGAFVPVWPLARDGALGAVTGQFRPNLTAPATPASFIFDLNSGQLVDAWATAMTQLAVPPGATFQPDQYYLDDANQLSADAGSVTLSADGVTLTRRALPSGAYAVGVSAENSRGDGANQFSPATVANDSLRPDYAVFFDAESGFQFLYPAAWTAPAYDEFGERLLTSSGADGTVAFQVKLYPPSDSDAEALKSAVLADWQGVDVVYADGVTLDGTAGTRTAYGYTSSDGPRQGVFVTVAHEEMGVVIDLDAPAAAITDTLATMGVLIDSWQFEPPAADVLRPTWAISDDDTAAVLIPPAFDFEALDSGWARFTQVDDARAFIARRTVNNAGRDLAAAVAYWLGVAGRDSATFSAEPTTRVDLNGDVWSRSDFTYQTAGGRDISGAILLSITDAERVVWVEAPTAAFPTVVELALIQIAADAR